MNRSSKLVALAVALVAAASAPLQGQAATPKWSVGVESMFGGDDRTAEVMLSIHAARTLIAYSVFSGAVDVMYGSGAASVKCTLECDPRFLGRILVSSGVLTIGDRDDWPLKIRVGAGHYHAKWNGSYAPAASDPEPSGIMLNGGIAGRIPWLRPSIEAELSWRGFDRLGVELTRTFAARLSYRF